jgi:hypothetical protein
MYKLRAAEMNPTVKYIDWRKLFVTITFKGRKRISYTMTEAIFEPRK